MRIHYRQQPRISAAQKRELARIEQAEARNTPRNRLEKELDRLRKGEQE